jgi:uncharacterized membrane protein
MFGEEPAQQIRADLRRLKEMLENPRTLEPWNPGTLEPSNP